MMQDASYWQLAALGLSVALVMIGQADSGQGGILLTGLALFLATAIWMVLP